MAVKLRQGIVLFLVMIGLFSVSGCSISFVKEDNQEVVPTEKPFFVNLLPIPDSPNQSATPFQSDMMDKAMAKFGQNEDTIGWLVVPNTTIDDVVLFYPHAEDKFFYIRRGFDKRYSMDGSYFIDYRSQFDGSRTNLSQNTVIYGHSMNDDPNSPLFSQLKKFQEPEFARDNPYVYFSSLEEDMVWEIFSVFTTKVNFIYNIPDSTPEKFLEIIEGSRSRSFYNYDVEVGAEDHILTLSTCIYNVDGVYHPYPNNYRYVVMAKLVPADAELKGLATFELNEDRIQP